MLHVVLMLLFKFANKEKRPRRRVSDVPIVHAPVLGRKSDACGTSGYASCGSPFSDTGLHLWQDSTPRALVFGRLTNMIIGFQHSIRKVQSQYRERLRCTNKAQRLHINIVSHHILNRSGGMMRVGDTQSCHMIDQIVIFLDCQEH